MESICSRLRRLLIFISFALLRFIGERLIKNMQQLFDGAVLEPCLLHGDLWSGNISSDKNGDPVILDPACYCKLHITRCGKC